MMEFGEVAPSRASVPPGQVDMSLQCRKPDGARKFYNSNYQKEILAAAHQCCLNLQYTDLKIHCEDGVILAHQIVLAVASPFLTQLFQSSSEAGGGGGEVVLVLPEVKANQVQALLHFVYTGKVVTQEGQFYSLMKLVYALSINASIEAESTSGHPTKFDTVVNSLKKASTNCDDYLAKKRPRLEEKTFRPALSTPQDLDSHKNLLQDLQLPSLPVNKPLAVNSLTASGVVIKEEEDVEEKPKIGANSTDGMPAVTTGQLGHFVSVNPSYQVKVELPSQPVPVTSLSSGSVLAQPQHPAANGKDQNASDDPLAAIMNQTIFGGENMYITVVNGGGEQSFLPVASNGPAAEQAASNGTTVQQWQKADQQAPAAAAGTLATAAHAEEDANSSPRVPESVDDLPCAPDDEDLNIAYNCETCNRSIKGKVMLQAHQYQEHYENPQYDSSSFPDDKFACRVCLKLFTRNSDVKAHILRVHCGDRRYPCTMCGKRFKESTHLRKHLYTHTGERPHYCQLCTKGFQTSSDLKRHKRTRVHQEKVEQAKSGNVPASESEPCMDTNAEFNRWTDEEENSDCSPLRGGFIGGTGQPRSNHASSPMPNLNSLIRVTMAQTGQAQTISDSSAPRINVSSIMSSAIAEPSNMTSMANNFLTTVTPPALARMNVNSGSQSPASNQAGLNRNNSQPNSTFGGATVVQARPSTGASYSSNPVTLTTRANHHNSNTDCSQASMARSSPSLSMPSLSSPTAGLFPAQDGANGQATFTMTSSTTSLPFSNSVSTFATTSANLQLLCNNTSPSILKSLTPSQTISATQTTVSRPQATTGTFPSVAQPRSAAATLPSFPTLPNSGSLVVSNNSSFNSNNSQYNTGAVLNSSTLDLSDLSLKWGLSAGLKRTGSTESPSQDEERLTIQEDLDP